MDDELKSRIRRLYAAVGEIATDDIAQFRPVTGRVGNMQFMYGDFRGGLNDEQLSNIAHIAIGNVANLRNHLYAWAGRKGLDVAPITDAVRQSVALQILIDLANNERHGYPPRPGQSQSGRNPRLSEVNRVLSISSGSEPNSGAFVAFAPMPTAQVVGSGSARVVITGTIVDDTGAFIAQLDSILEDGTKAWEILFPTLGLVL